MTLKITIFTWNYIFKWWMFRCPVRFWGVTFIVFKTIRGLSLDFSDWFWGLSLHKQLQLQNLGRFKWFSRVQNAQTLSTLLSTYKHSSWGFYHRMCHKSPLNFFVAPSELPFKERSYIPPMGKFVSKSSAQKCRKHGIGWLLVPRRAMLVGW